jgi:6,7-dimethyl-8-ribityllumazine synthase
MEVLPKRILIIDANYYDEISANLINGINSAIEDLGQKDTEIKKSNIFLSHRIVSGALEIPQAINLILSNEFHHSFENRISGIIAVGCVIRGETSHYDIVADNSARGIMDLSFKYNIPITNAILTVDNYDQAIKRSKDKGQHALKALLGLINLTIIDDFSR